MRLGLLLRAALLALLPAAFDAGRSKNMRRLIARSLCLLAAAVALLAASPGSSERIDLTDLIAPALLPGDYKVFVDSSGAWARQEVLEVAEDAESRTVSGIFVDAEGDEEQFRHVAVRGDRMFLLDNASGPNGCPAFVNELNGRDRIFEFSMRPNQVKPYSRLYRVHQPFYRLQARLRGRQLYVGMRPLETSFGSFPEATRIDTRRRVAVFKKRTYGRFEDLRFRPTRMKERLRVESWFVDGIGLVGERGVRRFYGRGGEVERVEYEYWLREAMIGGVRYP